MMIIEVLESGQGLVSSRLDRKTYVVKFLLNTGSSEWFMVISNVSMVHSNTFLFGSVRHILHTLLCTPLLRNLNLGGSG